jgi:hypothetical protein
LLDDAFFSSLMEPWTIDEAASGDGPRQGRRQIASIGAFTGRTNRTAKAANVQAPVSRRAQEKGIVTLFALIAGAHLEFSLSPAAQHGQHTAQPAHRSLHSVFPESDVLE